MESLNRKKLCQLLTGSTNKSCYSLKNCPADIDEEALGRLDLPNIQDYEIMNDVFSNFI